MFRLSKSMCGEVRLPSEPRSKTNAARDMHSTYDDIDRELETLREAVRRLKTERNALSTSCKLPAEILSMIFLCVVDAGPTGEPADFRGPCIKNWYAITLVCRRWREVALGCPTLWNRIDVKSPYWTPEMVRRSKQAALSLRAEVHHTPSDMPKLNACKLVLAQTSRLREVHLAGDRPSLTQLVTSLNGTHAPSLGSLIIRNRHWRNDVDVLQLPQSLLSAGAPRLERLEIWKCAVPWESPLLLTSASLTTLVVQGSRHTDCRPSMSQLLSALSCMPMLRHLFLEDTLPTIDDDPTLAETILRHETLRTLCLKGTFIECARFLHHLALSPAVSTTFRCRDARKLEEIVDFATAFAQARKAFYTASTPSRPIPVASWSIVLEPMLFHLSGSSAQPSLPNASHDSDIYSDKDNSLAVMVESVSQSACWSIMKTLLCNLPISLSTTGSLLVGDNGSASTLDANRWTFLLERLPHLTSLQVFRAAALHLPAALANTSTSGHAAANPDGAPSETLSALVPHLDLLSLHHADANWSFPSSAPTTTTSTTAHTPLPFLHALQDAQITRTHLGVPIDSLHLSGCTNLGRTEYLTLCQLFVEVEWDGAERYTACSSVIPFAASPDVGHAEGEWWENEEGVWEWSEPWGDWPLWLP